MARLPTYDGVILDDWLDYNGHLNVAYYLMAFDKATDELFDHWGVGADYVEQAQHSFFAVEQHLVYDREMLGGAPFKIETSLVDYDSRRLHLIMAMIHGAEGYQAATAEMMFVHVDMTARRAAAIPEVVSNKLASEQKLAADDPLMARVARSMVMAKR